MAPREPIFKSQKPPSRFSETSNARSLSVTTHVPQRHQQSHVPKPTPRLFVDHNLTNRLYPQKIECSASIRDGDDDNASECFYSAADGNNKEWIQDVDVYSHQSRWSPFGVTQNTNKAKMDFTWPQHTIQAPCSRSRPQGGSRRHRIGDDTAVQTRPSTRPLQPEQQQHQQQEQQNSYETHQPIPSQTQPDIPRQRRQLSVRYMRYLSTKPLPVLSRPTSTSKSRKRSTGPAIATTTSRYFGSNLQLNKPLPPIPNVANPCIGGFPLSEECLDSLIAPQDGYHEAISNREGIEAASSSSSRRGSKQEMQASLLQQSGRSKKAIDSTMVGAADMAVARGGRKQDLCCDGAPWVDGSERKVELIQTNTLGKPSAIPKDELFVPSKGDALGKDKSNSKDEVNGQGEKSTPPAADDSGRSFSIPTTLKTKDLTFASTSNNKNNTSPTSIATLSLKRLESFRFPLRKSPIEKYPMARPRIHQCHHHSHHHSLPYNTATATHAHRLSKAAFDAHHQHLTASDLVHQGLGPIPHSNTTLSALSTTAPAASTPTLHSEAEPGQSSLDANGTSFSTTTSHEGKESEPGGSSRQHDTGWVSERYRRQIGQQRLSRRSDSCSSISYHRPSLSFDSSKKALLSLQARRVNKPDAKVHLLPEILTTATGSIASTHGPAVRVIPQGSAGAQLEGNENDGLLSGLETPVATADLLNTVLRTATLPTLFCGTPVLAPTTVSKIVATAGMASAAVDFPQDNTDYQLRVSEKDRVVVDSILIELTATETFPSETKTIDGDDMVADRDISQTDVSVHGDDAKGEQGNNSTTATVAVVVHESTPPLSETNLSTALTAFKMESRPAVDAGEIKRFVKRSHALQELEVTEQSYVNDLDILVHVHLRILETKSWFPQNVHTSMRRCVIRLLALHRDFLSQIQACKPSETDHEKRAPLMVYSALEVAFRALSRDHQLYSQFCELRMRTVNEINRTVGQSIIAGMQKESKELMAQQGRPKSRSDLKDHLIKPIQRICRYPLLLKEILRLTSSDDPEYEFIDRAHKCMKALAQQMDETQRTTERKLLTEQFLKKLPETNFPRKFGIGAPIHSASSPSHNSNADSHYQQNHHRQVSGGAIHALSSTANGPSEELFEGGLFGEGILPRSLSKTYVGTLGSIVLAGALEYVIMPDMPIRLRYYGCFLFESMLIVVKAKKTSLYEPRQWLPLRLCELYETTRLDGYTRYGWRIMYDQFRIDFGASCEAERQAWMTALQTHIQAAKLAHARLPRNTAALETVVSSLPWNMARPSTFPSSGSLGSLVVSGPSRQAQAYQQPPSPTPSPWSTCSSAIPSPLMPPPPMATSSTPSTMMMAMSFMTNSEEPEKWNDRGTPGVSLDAYAQYYEQHIHPHSYEPTPAETYGPSRIALTRHQSVDSSDDMTRGYGMVGNRSGNNASSNTTNSNQQDQCYNPLNRSLSQPRTRPSNEFNPLSARKSESAASGAGHLLFPSTPFPWLVPDSRPRSHSFDVTKVFASSHSGIKPNQRNLVQSMFKDVSAENIWTTTNVTTTSHSSQPSPQPIPSANSSSPMASRTGRYGTPLPFSYFNSNSSSSSNTVGGSGSLPPPMSPKAITGMVPSTSGHSGKGEDDDTPALTPTLQTAGSSCPSLTSRLLRRKDSGNSAKDSPNGSSLASSEKTEWDRRRSSATAAIAATLSFRKNSESSTHNIRHRDQHHRCRLSISDPAAILSNNNDHTTAAGVATSARDGDGIYQRISVRAQAQLIEKKATHGLTPSFTSASSLAGSRNKSKKASGFAEGRLKPNHGGQNLTSSFAVASSSSSYMASLAMNNTNGESLSTSLLGTDIESDPEILNSLSSAAGEAARSRRGNGSSERIQRRSPGVALAMTSIDDSTNTATTLVSSSTTSTDLRPLNSTKSLPVYFASNNSSTHSLVHSQPTGDVTHKDNAVEKMWTAMGRLTHKRSAGDRHSSSGSSKSHHSQHQQYQGNAQASNQISGSFVGESAKDDGKTDVDGTPHPLGRFSIHASDSCSLKMVPHSGDASPITAIASADTNASGWNHYRTVSESTVRSMDSATSIMSNGSISHHQHGILEDMGSSSPSSVPQLTLTPSGSTRSRSSSKSSVHSNIFSIHDHTQSNDLHYRPHSHSKPQYHEARQPPLPWSFSDDHHHHQRENSLAGGMAVGTDSPCSSSSSSQHHSDGSGSRKSISSSSASSFSPTLYYHQDQYQFQLSAIHGRSATAKMPISFQEGYEPVLPHTLHHDPSIQDRRKSLSILQNLTQASQKIKTMIRSPSVRMRRRTVMNLSPLTMDHYAAARAVEDGMSVEFGSGRTDVLTEAMEDEVRSGIRLSGEIDVEPLMSEKDMEEIFGADRAVNEAV
ncbi:hypothetical protein BG015_011955 [Linnemannia schmuckeri]|uniref:DH domain-containing protein n=1 Tax=Linnemannia schmuckeri TaxID=64567 RepID=A0A9P5RUC5_9FUNG|nr:hypothetical protein BG015_011955 [Linnemannia schmuckeri]